MLCFVASSFHLENIATARNTKKKTPSPNSSHQELSPKYIVKTSIFILLSSPLMSNAEGIAVGRGNGIVCYDLEGGRGGAQP